MLHKLLEYNPTWNLDVSSRLRSSLIQLEHHLKLEVQTTSCMCKSIFCQSSLSLVIYLCLIFIVFLCDEREKWELTCHHELELPIPHHDKQYRWDLFNKKSHIGISTFWFSNKKHTLQCLKIKKWALSPHYHN